MTFSNFDEGTDTKAPHRISRRLSTLFLYCERLQTGGEEMCDQCPGVAVEPGCQVDIWTEEKVTERQIKMEIGEQPTVVFL